MACSNRAIVDLPTRSTLGSASLGSVLWRGRATLRTWLIRRRQRRALGDLDDHLLRDIGLTPAEVARERAKRFWHP
jgi:uncharacterized protein YjiS (DUF1127 family)